MAGSHPLYWRLWFPWWCVYAAHVKHKHIHKKDKELVARSTQCFFYMRWIWSTALERGRCWSNLCYFKTVLINMVMTYWHFFIQTMPTHYPAVERERWKCMTVYFNKHGYEMAYVYFCCQSLQPNIYLVPHLYCSIVELRIPLGFLWNCVPWSTMS